MVMMLLSPSKVTDAINSLYEKWKSLRDASISERNNYHNNIKAEIQQIKYTLIYLVCSIQYNEQ